MLDKSLALSIIREDRPSSGPRYTYIFKCLKCPSTIRVRSDALKTATGKCKSCNGKKRPFESIYKGLFGDHRGTLVSISYEDFLDFTKTDSCHFCGDKVNWIPYGTVDGKYISRGYYLDRYDNNVGYTKENCVVCCSRCNKFKGSLHGDYFIALCKQIAENS